MARKKKTAKKKSAARHEDERKLAFYAVRAWTPTPSVVGQVHTDLYGVLELTLNPGVTLAADDILRFVPDEVPDEEEDDGSDDDE